MDLDLYQRAVKLCPDLWYATQLVERIRGKDVFPIDTVDALVSVFASKSKLHLKLDGVTLIPEHASKFFPVKYLPITDENDLLVKLYSVFLNSKEIHLLEAKLERYKRSISEKEVRGAN
ncbi:MAG: hypothetical protein WBE76_09590 [Terracidiphilus sp.]